MVLKKSNILRPIAAVLATLFFVFGAITIFKASAEDNQGDFSAVFSSEGYTHNSKFDSYDKLFIIDTSSFNTVTDWNKVYKAGIYGVMLRIGYRGYKTASFNMDSSFESSYTAAKNAGLKVGVYFYGQPVSAADSTSEAEYVLSVLNGRSLDLPVAYDLEYAESNGSFTGRFYEADLSKLELTNIYNTFCRKVASSGYSTMIYTNAFLLTQHTAPALLMYPVWLARYNSYVDYDVNYDMWQYTSKGHVDGISGNVDISVKYIYNPAPATTETTSDNTSDPPPVSQTDPDPSSTTTTQPDQSSVPDEPQETENDFSWIANILALVINWFTLIISLIGKLISGMQ